MAKMKKINWKSKKTWKNVLLIGLACITLVGAIAGISALFKKSEETTMEINPTYEIGGLTETGGYLETEESIYTKDAFECQGLDVELDFKSNVSYRIFFYDNENDFLSSTSKQTGNYDETTTPELARYARIVITPNEDEEIKWYEKNGYANQLTISVNKEQKFVLIDYFATGVHSTGQVLSGDVGSAFEWVTRDGFNTVAIDCSNHTSYKITYEDGITSTYIFYHFVDASGNIVAKEFQPEGVSELVISVPTGATTLYMAYTDAKPFVVNAN